MMLCVHHQEARQVHDPQWIVKKCVYDVRRVRGLVVFRSNIQDVPRS